MEVQKHCEEICFSTKRGRDEMVSGWWNLEITGLDVEDLTDIEREFIADKIIEGQTSGTIERESEEGF